MQIAYRDFKCRNCGHVQSIKTNHEMNCIDYCKNCSWKPSFGGDVAIPFMGFEAYRNFDFNKGGHNETVSDIYRRERERRIVSK